MATPETDATGESAAIDAEFSETPATPPPPAKESSSPGWTALIAAGVFASLAGGAIGVVASGTEGKFAQASEVAVDISTLKQGDRALSARLDSIRTDVREAQARLDAGLEQLNGFTAAETANTSGLAADIAALEARYVALLGTAAVPAETATPPANAGAGNPPAAGEGTAQTAAAPADPGLPLPSFTLADLAGRLDAMASFSGESQDTTAKIPPALTAAVADARERLGKLETRTAEINKTLTESRTELAALSKSAQTLTRSVSEVDGTAKKNAAAVKRLSDQPAVDGKALSAQIAALKTRVDKAVADLANVSRAAPPELEARERKADAMLALATLESAARKGGAISQEVDRLGDMLPANADIAALRQITLERVPTRESLIASWPKAAQAARAAQADAVREREGGWAWLGAALSTIVTVREPDEFNGLSLTKRLAAAGDALAGDDLAGALQVLQPVTGPPRQALADWRAKAEARLQLDTRLDTLRAAVVQLEN